MATIGYFEIVLAFLSFFFLCYWRKNRNSPALTNWPVVGMMPSLLCNALHLHDFATHVMKKSEATFDFQGPAWFLKVDFLVTCDPLNINHILSRNFINYEKGSEFREIFEPLGDGIFRSDSDLWKFQRKVIHSVLKNNKYELFSAKIVWQKLVKGLLPVLEYFARLGTEVDLQDVLQRFTFDNVCSLVLGFDPNCLSIELPDVLYEKAIHVIEEASIYRHFMPTSIWKLQRWLQIGQEKKFKAAWNALDNFIYQCISRKQEKLNRIKTHEEEDEFDFLTAFMAAAAEAEQEEGATAAAKRLKSDEFLRDASFNLMIAGRDTMSSCLCWFFWLVATHPLVETKILEEIKSNLSGNEDWNKQDGVFSTQELQDKFIYLHAALCETLRLYPSVPINEYTAIHADVTPTGHHVDPKTRILIPFYAMGRMESIWGEDCSEFKPERWISEAKGSIKHFPSYKFTAFNLGPRACLGKEISLIQMKMVAIALLWNFHVQVVEGHNVLPSNSIILHMRSGLKIRVTKRSMC